MLLWPRGPGWTVVAPGLEMTEDSTDTQSLRSRAPGIIKPSGVRSAGNRQVTEGKFEGRQGRPGCSPPGADP